MCLGSTEQGTKLYDRQVHWLLLGGRQAQRLPAGASNGSSAAQPPLPALPPLSTATAQQFC